MLPDLVTGVLLGSGGTCFLLVLDGYLLLRSLGVPLAGRLLVSTFAVMTLAALVLGVGLLGLMTRG